MHVLFEDRLILDAQPPVEDAVLDAVAARCAGPLPDGLLALWRTAFGGRLDYDLRCRFGDVEVEASWTELFFPGSDGYRDLWGWIEHEAELAEEAAEEDGVRWSGRLDFLPIGGFEYLERVYVVVTPGPDHGSVVLWRQALPPAWNGPLESDSVTTLAPDLRSAFRLLDLAADPWRSAAGQDGGFGSGTEIAEALDALAARDPEGRAEAARLQALVRATVRR